MIRVVDNPQIQKWGDLISRPVSNLSEINEIVQAIGNNVKTIGDDALREYTLKYDRVNIESFQVSEEDIQSAGSQVAGDLQNAISLAHKNIRIFHEAQREKVNIIESVPGLKCWRKSVPIEKVGLYIPGGSAPLFSTILMLGIPAQLAGCKDIVLCTPPDLQGKIAPVVLYTASLLGIKRIYKVGGAQAIAALAYGTESIPNVNKIFGPGNQYVTAAKLAVQMDGMAIDMPAGPSEILLIADQTCNPAFVAADLLSQAEHGPDSQVILLSNKMPVIATCIKEIEKQLQNLSRKQIIEQALKNSIVICFEDLNVCMKFSNNYAPEHLIICTKNAEYLASKVINAGSVFIGNYSCESIGDYASGPNHTLPTNGYAKSYSGISLDSFFKKITFQQVNKEGLNGIGSAVSLMADAEGLSAHRNAVEIRLNETNV